jgi:ABC-2 type transport system ATP-binding protein
VTTSGWLAPDGSPATPTGPAATGDAAAGDAAGADAALASIPPDAAIRVERASRWYGNVVAVNDVTFGVGPGITGLLGPNGAGKSTLLGMIAGTLRPSAGRVTLLGTPAWRNPSVYARVGIVPEREAVPGYLTGRAFAEYGARLQGLADPAAAAARALVTVDLEPAADRAIGTYSKGMRQRIKLAAALVHDPPVLLLDEPFNGMDPRQRLHMMDLLRTMAAAGRTILFSSHILEEVERLAERVLVVYAGRLAASGDFREIRRLMIDRPHAFTIRSSDDRHLAAALLADPSVAAASLDDGWLSVRTTDFARFTRMLAPAARAAGVSLYEVQPADESLERVFAYLVEGR